jgi:lysine-specific demethylase 8
MNDTPALPFAGPVPGRPAGEITELRPGSPLLREPVVLTGASELMSEVWRWTPDYLRGLIGDETLDATLPAADGKFAYEPGRALASRPLAVARFFDDVADPDGPRWCLQQVAVRDRLPALAERLDYPSCVPPELINAVNLWMAAPGTVTPLHYDDTHNLFAQVYGAKTFYLFPPENLDALYPGPLNTGAQHLSRVDLFHPDLSRHPRAVSLSYRTATVRAGEALLLPAFWWHQVASQDVSVSVNFWWRAHVLDVLCPGFMRQLQSTAVQEDLGALVRTFELGDAGDDPVRAAGGLLELLADIGETRAAVALARSILHTAERRPSTTARARQLLARHPEPDLRLVADTVTFLGEGALVW